MAAQRGCAASAWRSARSASSKPSAWLGCRPTAVSTWGKSSAACRALRFVAASIPTVSIRVTPSRAAAATSSAFGGPQESRCVWLSFTGWPIRGPARRAGAGPWMPVVAGRLRHSASARAESARGDPAPRNGARASWGTPDWSSELREELAELADRADRPRAEAGVGEAELRRAEGGEELLGGAGDPGREQHGDDAQPLGQGAQDAIEVGRTLGVLGQLPGRLLLDVAIEPTHALPDVVERGRELDAVDALGHAVGEAVEVGCERCVDLDVGDAPVAIAPDHREGSVGEVAELVGQLGVVAALEGLGRHGAVLAEGDVAQQVVAQGVGPEALDDLEGVEHVAQRLAHLLAVHQQVAVDEYVLGHDHVGEHQHRRPEDRVQTQDVLVDDLVGRRPELLGQVLALAREAEGGVVVEQRVEPDVEDVARIPGDRDPPRQLGA